jgi:nicotinamide phosphoribosyltransferase
MQCLHNLLLNTDSYKASHWLQYPPGTDSTFFYVESRGGLYDRTLFYGLQAILKEYLAKPITHADVDEARDVFAAHGEPFNETGWRYIIERGHLPIRVRAVPEGTVVPTHQALVTIESTDPDAYWVPSYLETMLLRLWYPVTVATISWHAKQTIQQFLERTSDDPLGQLPFKLHDFGARGVSSAESAALGGSAHLVNFMGTDNVSGLLAARAYYHEPMAGFSIPAAEHSTIASWGRENEVEAYRNMLRQFAKPGSVNGKGYKVLNHVRVIQGDGINPNSNRAILERATSAGYATDNLAFGMGGGLLQQLNRDTQKFALKCSAARVDGHWIDVYKDPVTDKSKQSKRGRMTLLRHRELGTFQTVPVPPEANSLADVVKPLGYDDAMVTVRENGHLVHDWTFAEVRSRADATRL